MQGLIHENYKERFEDMDDWDRWGVIEYGTQLQMISKMFSKVNVYANTLAVESVEESPKYDVRCQS
jgi:hypothetical protein